MQPSPLVAVIVLTMNQRAKTLRCLESIGKQTGPPFKVFLWDNGSQDETIAAVRADFPSVVTHHHPCNLGVASGRNAAARMAVQMINPSHLLFLDNDMALEDRFIASMLQPFHQDSRLAQTQAKLRFMHDPIRLNDAGGCKINFLLGTTRSVGYGEIDRGQHDNRKSCVCGGGAMMVRTDVFQMLRGFDPVFDPFGPEDIDFSLRLRQAGYQTLFVPEAVAYHEKSHTYGRDYHAAYAQQRARHWLILLGRHAPVWKRVVFVAVTAPWLFLKILVRELVRGNFSAILGILRGVADSMRGPDATLESARWRPGGPQNDNGADRGKRG